MEEIKEIGGNDDFFICSAGFEDRTLGVVNKFHKYLCQNSILIKYKQTDVQTPSSEENEVKLKEILKGVSNLNEIEINPSNPTSSICSMVKGIAKSIGNGTISVDISTMSRYLLLVFLRSLYENHLLEKTKLLYTEPVKYVISNNRPLSLGTKEIETIPTFEGIHHPRHNTLLVLLLGFEGDRSFALWEKIEPDKCILLYPYPAYNRDWEGKTKELNLALVNAVGDDKYIRLDSKDPLAVMSKLEETINKIDPTGLMNCIIAPLGTKPQAVGTFLYYIKSKMRPTIMYTWPKKHTDYSEGIGKTYVIPHY